MSGLANRLKDALNVDGYRVFTGTGNVTMANEGTLEVKKATGAATTVTLPANPKAGWHRWVKDGKGDANTNNITVQASTGNIDDAATFVISNNYGSALFVYDGSQWRVQGGYNLSSVTGPLSVSGALTVTSTSASSLAVGPNGATNPTLKVDGSTASAATGLKVKSAAAGSGLALSVITSGTNEPLTLDAAGSGIVNIGSVSTGPVVLGRGAASVIVENCTLTSLAGTNQTLTAAQLLGGIIEHAPTGAATDTTDTATNLDAAYAAATKDTFVTTLINTSAGANAITLAGGSGVTLKGSATTVGQNKTATLTFRRTGAGAWTCYVTISA